MNAFANLNAAPLPDIIALLTAAALILFSISAMVVASATRLKRPLSRGVAAVVLDVIVFHAVFDDCTAKVMGRQPVSLMGRLVYTLPADAVIALIVILLAIVIYRFTALERLQKNTITYFSVGEALRDLPIGVLFFSPEGQIMQTNRLMEELNYDLTKAPLINGDRFWSIVKKKAAEDTPGSGSWTQLVHTEDGKTWIFTRELRHCPVTDFYQILASDATEEKALSEEADANVRRLEEMNRRLQAYNIVVDDTVRKEELLETKRRVHDNMGTDLLAAKMLITNEDSPVTPERLLDQWREALTLLREEAREGEEENDNQFERFREVAGFLGIDLQIAGKFPEHYEAADLVAVGIQECMTNAIQHAGADQMYVTISEDEDEYTATYSNNGRDAVLPVVEGGGLSLLRSRAERIGAVMEYLPMRHFCLVLHIPKLR